MSNSRLMLGMSVEVKSNESRYRGAWLQGVMVAIYVPPWRAHRYKIRYQQQFQFLMDNGQPLTGEDLSYTQVRPVPPLLLSHAHSYSVGDIVEVYDYHCWWWGSVIKVFHDNDSFLIHNPQTGCFNKFPLSKLRLPLQWSKGSWSLLYSKHSSDVIYDGNCPVAENSEQSSVASCPGDMQSQEQPEEEVNKQRRPSGLIGTRAPQKNQECSSLLNVKRVVKDSRQSKSFGNGLKNGEARPLKGVKRPYVPDDRRDRSLNGIQNGLKNVEGLSMRRNSPARPSKGVKRPCVRDDRRDGTFSGIQIGKCDNVKRFKRGDSAKAMEQRIKTHEMELLVYRSVLKAFYDQNPSSLSFEYHCLLTDLRIQLHITSDENIRELKRVTSQS